ncbi:hypothetical protein C8Q75DRAFT_812066 [Abortiporus biennis]|nr:hypothetical protein C8Q75DRAFT_812066 [Abortiporus biennis]
MSDETAEIVNSFWVAFFGTASYVSMAALAVYDYCITFDQELQYIWKKKTFNLSSAIFIVNRYATLMVVLGTAALELFPRTLQDAFSALGGVLSFLVLCSTLAKTLALKTAANQAGIKGTLITLLIRDGTLYLCLTFVLNILEAILFNIHSQAPGIEVILGPVDWLRPIILSRMILDLKSIDQVSMASLPDIRSSRFSSINFVGNIGGPLNTLPVNENDSTDEDQLVTSSGATVPRISAKQIIEDPLSIGLFDEKYDDPNVEREFASHVVEASVKESEA